MRRIIDFNSVYKYQYIITIWVDKDQWHFYLIYPKAERFLTYKNYYWLDY